MKIKLSVIGIFFIVITSLYISCDYEDEDRHESKSLLLPKSSYYNYVLNKAISEEKEYSLGYLGLDEDYDLYLKEEETESDDYKSLSFPSYFNWADQGAVTVAKDQGNCGSCWAFASVGVLESKIIINYKTVFDLSEQQQVSCNNDSHGCDGGYLSSLLFWDVDHDNNGPMLESCTGYCACDLSCSVLYDDYGCSEMNYRTKDFYTVNYKKINSMKTSIYNDGPATFGFRVYSDFYTYWYNGEYESVYINSNSTYRGNHAVLIIGWDDSKNAWLCKNSWGATTGPNGNGTFWIAYDGHLNYLNIGMANCEVQNVPHKVYKTPCDIPGQNINCCF